MMGETLTYPIVAKRPISQGKEVSIIANRNYTTLELYLMLEMRFSRTNKIEDCLGLPLFVEILTGQ